MQSTYIVPQTKPLRWLPWVLWHCLGFLIVGIVYLFTLREFWISIFIFFVFQGYLLRNVIHNGSQWSVVSTIGFILGYFFQVILWNFVDIEVSPRFEMWFFWMQNILISGGSVALCQYITLRKRVNARTWLWIPSQILALSSIAGTIFGCSWMMENMFKIDLRGNGHSIPPIFLYLPFLAAIAAIPYGLITYAALKSILRDRFVKTYNLSA